MRFLLAMSVMLAAVGSQPARADDCAEAWHQCNLMDKQAGDCFRPSRGIRAFGNTGCSYDAVQD